jgi:hypothetical protein
MKLINNKRGGTLTNWIFIIATILLFVVVFQTAVLVPMNEIYNKTFETGLNTSGLNDLQSLKSTSDSEIQGAEVTQTSEGLTLKSAWTVGKGAYNTVLSFIGGNFIYQLAEMLDLPEIVPQTIVILIWISLIMIIVYIFMKVVP